jgi:hypothetical protein
MVINNIEIFYLIIQEEFLLGRESVIALEFFRLIPVYKYGKLKIIINLTCSNKFLIPVIKSHV